MSPSRAYSRHQPRSFCTDTSTAEFYTLSLHDALPISTSSCRTRKGAGFTCRPARRGAVVLTVYRGAWCPFCNLRSEEHTSELQSQFHLVCGRLLEKRNATIVPLPKQAVRLSGGPGYTA